LIALDEAAQRIARLGEDLAAAIRKPNRTEYQSLRKAYEIARQVTERAHKAYFDHRAEHGC
jgi:hypothetical protein